MRPLFFLAALLATTHAFAAEEAFEPAKTYAVIAGVLRWTDPSFHAFSPEDRKDRELYETLGRRGVPAAQRVLLLDEEATSSKIIGALKKMIAAAPAGSTLVFYYAGHGVKSGGDVLFASSEIASSNFDGTGLHLSSLAKLFEGFKGDNVLLFADCCYSGGLISVAKAISERGKHALALTSAEATNTSTGNWTFTQTLVDVFQGRELFDLDDSGSISLGELARGVADAMKNRESQLYGFGDFGLSEAMVVSTSQPSRERYERAAGYERRSWVRAKNGRGVVEPARVLGARDGKLVVAFYDYATETTRALAPADVQRLSFKSYPAGTAVDVTWGGKAWEAKVLKENEGFHYITYPGFEATWDEWVMGDRIVGLHDPKRTKVAQRIQVKWGDKWWDAVIVSKKGAKSCIHYIGYEESWDECVEPSRVRVVP